MTAPARSVPGILGSAVGRKAGRDIGEFLPESEHQRGSRLY